MAKFRNGFVTNSSSSSFLIAVKGDLQQELEKAILVDESHPLYKLSKDIVACIVSCCNRNSRYYKNPLSYEDVVKDYTDDETPVPSWIKKLRKTDFNVFYKGSFEDQSEEIETLLCETDMDIDSDNLFMIHNGGY